MLLRDARWRACKVVRSILVRLFSDVETKRIRVHGSQEVQISGDAKFESNNKLKFWPQALRLRFQLPDSDDTNICIRIRLKKTTRRLADSYAYNEILRRAGTRLDCPQDVVCTTSQSHERHWQPGDMYGEPGVYRDTRILYNLSCKLSLCQCCHS